MGQADPYLLLDVRTPEEYKQIRIDGAKLLPVDELARRAPSELPDKNILILIYCQSGMRATQAVKILTKMGYTNVVSFGGIINWRYGTTRG
ncbi:MAG: rhodanese-like domain-containing protein [Peptococcaceae bacterium]|nr:rhodanese-like domain-containing protein [Peptococcaceae bacterium]